MLNRAMGTGIIRVNCGNVNRILIRSTNWVGDAILTTPALGAVRENFPCARISVLAKPWVKPVFFHNPSIDRLLCYEDGGRHRGALGTLRLSRDLRRERFDLAILFQNAFEAALIAFLAGIPMRLGYDTDARKMLLTHAIHLEPAARRIHETRYYRGILEGAGLKTQDNAPAVFLSAAERRWAQERLAGYGRDEGQPVIAVGPGATYGSAKRWMPERFARLCDRLCDRYRALVVILGGAGERRVGDDMVRQMRSPAANLCGATGLREAMALIGACSLFVTNDSGLMHVAAALDIPLVAVFGPTNPVTTGPGGKKSRVVRVPVPCAPCLKPECPTDHRCMKEVTVDMVYQAAEALLNKTG